VGLCRLNQASLCVERQECSGNGDDEMRGVGIIRKAALYVGYDAVLVRLSRVNPDVLRDLLGMAYRFVTRNATPRSPARKRGKFGPTK
jgi:hypothetical protein